MVYTKEAKHKYKVVEPVKELAEFFSPPLLLLKPHQIPAKSNKLF